jgi:adenine-specific DNA-methyltransferase
VTDLFVQAHPAPLAEAVGQRQNRHWRKKNEFANMTCMDTVVDIRAADIGERERKGGIGQFFTSSMVADFMASMFGPLPQTVRILDAGAGYGMLTTAFVARCCAAGDVRAIEATLYEIDGQVLDVLNAAMRDCGRLCAASNIRFSFTIHATDFIHEMSTRLTEGLFGSAPPVFDAAIVNPPYRKIGVDSRERKSLHAAGIDTGNLYTAFIALIYRLLAPDGQLVAITPRSFCNGPYFRSFRKDILKRMELRRIHVFESRRAAFREDNVLQENIIFHAAKGNRQPHEIIISASSGKEGGEITQAVLPFAEVVHPEDAEKFIRIPSAVDHAAARETLSGLGESLASLGITVSTGPVVDFRFRESLRRKPEPGTAPLLYPCHFNGGTVCWPKLDARKPNAIVDNAKTRSWLVPSGTYLLTKRFSAKEERRRLVACVFDPGRVKAEWVGFENHLNYFHENGGGLEPALAAGLFAFLNSTVVDQYFRGFSGHTQVNATDLRALPYPGRNTLQTIGRELPAFDLAQNEIDQIVGRHIHAG